MSTSPWTRRVIPYRYTTKTCPRCDWPFQCPHEQDYRLYCRACEHKPEGERP